MLASASALFLPDAARDFLVAGDLTVVAPGGLAPDLDTRLTAMADRRVTGETVTWQLDETGVRRFLDAGETAAGVLGFLRAHSRTPLPQALVYMVEDAERRHGQLRVGAAAAYVHGDDALLTALLRSPAAATLGLRELAPGVVVSDRPVDEVLAGLRRAGAAPVREQADGMPSEVVRAVRHALGRHDPGRMQSGADQDDTGPTVTVAALLAALRGRSVSQVTRPETPGA